MKPTTTQATSKEGLQQDIIEKAWRDGFDSGIGCCGISTNTKENTLFEKWSEKNKKAVNERKALTDENEKVKRLLHGLTPGGSEFYNDPEYCAKWIRENREENHYSLSNIIKNLKDERKALLDALEAAKKMLLKMGVIIRQLDHNDEAIEYWNQDGDYISGDEFNKIETILNNANKHLIQ